jgi:hypothetical protein
MRNIYKNQIIGAVDFDIINKNKIDSIKTKIGELFSGSGLSQNANVKNVYNVTSGIVFYPGIYPPPDNMAWSTYTMATLGLSYNFNANNAYSYSYDFYINNVVISAKLHAKKYSGVYSSSNYDTSFYNIITGAAVPSDSNYDMNQNQKPNLPDLSSKINITQEDILIDIPINNLQIGDFNIAFNLGNTSFNGRIYTNTNYRRGIGAPTWINGNITIPYTYNHDCIATVEYIVPEYIELSISANSYKNISSDIIIGNGQNLQDIDFGNFMTFSTQKDGQILAYKIQTDIYNSWGNGKKKIKLKTIINDNIPIYKSNETVIVCKSLPIDLGADNTGQYNYETLTDNQRDNLIQNSLLLKYGLPMQFKIMKNKIDYNGSYTQTLELLEV